jgi:hypothetical protein
VYSDDQVQRVRELRTANLTCREIEEITGVPRGYVPTLARRQCRVTGTTEGWSRERILGAIRRFSARHGHAPTYRTADPLLPSPKTVARYFESWRAACHEAGCASSYEGRRMQPWTVEEIIRAFCELRLELGRWPSRLEIQQHAFLSVPSQCTLRRRFGSTSRRALVEAVAGGLAS